jgi:hypothetical protein
MLSGNGRKYDNGVENNPTKKAREKLRVAREARNIPRRSREKDLMSWYCCSVGRKKCVSKPAKMIGHSVATVAKTPNSIERDCYVLVVVANFLAHGAYRKRGNHTS